MHTASSAKRTCKELRSAYEYTATVGIPSSWHAHKTRNAISPRFAIKILRNIFFWAGASAGLLFPAGMNGEERLTVFHRLAILDKHTHHFARHIRLDFVHQLHGFDDAENAPRFHAVSGPNEWVGARSRR